MGKKRLKSVPLVSGRAPSASNTSRMTIVRHWGALPSWKGVDLAGRRRNVPPLEFGLLHFMTTAPVAPLRIVSAIATAIKEQAEEEIDVGSYAQLRLVELQMRHESGEIDDEEFAAREKKLQDILKHLEAGATPGSSGPAEKKKKRK